MIRIFRSKKIAVLIVAAAVVALLLVCMLLITLSQMLSLNQSAVNLQNQIEKLNGQKIELNDLLEFMKTDEYVKRWAENNGRMSEDDILWIADQLNNNK